jgi:hypothetical protein
MKSGRDSVVNSRRRIDTWLRATTSAQAVVLPSGATEEEIRAAESILGLRLPGDVRESHLVHNGSNEVWIFDHAFLMPLDEDPSSPSVVPLFDSAGQVRTPVTHQVSVFALRNLVP